MYLNASAHIIIIIIIIICAVKFHSHLQECQKKARINSTLRNRSKNYPSKTTDGTTTTAQSFRD